MIVIVSNTKESKITFLLFLIQFNRFLFPLFNLKLEHIQKNKKKRFWSQAVMKNDEKWK